jgi:hypothetical protein
MEIWMEFRRDAKWTIAGIEKIEIDPARGAGVEVLALTNTMPVVKALL